MIDPSRPLSIVVTGGNGLIARAAIHELESKGHSVTSIVRDPGRAVGERRNASRTIIGDAGDAEVIERAFEGADALVHLAAIPSPGTHSTDAMLTANTLLTARVLDGAVAHGLRAAVIASSVSILGMAWSADLMPPVYIPVDESHPLRPADAYALSKECDEATARMVARRSGLPIVALRLPFTHEADVIAQRAVDLTQATQLAKELWGYLDIRDASDAIQCAIRACLAGKVTGWEALNIVADDTAAPLPLRDLAASWYPDAPIRGGESRGAYDVARAESVIGFRARHLISGTHHQT